MNLNANISQELLESVEQYLNNNMSIEELQVFEKKLNNDSNFKAQVEDIKVLLLGIESQALKEQLNVFHEEIPETSTKNDSSRKVRYISLPLKKIAVAAAIVIAAGSFWFLNRSSNDKLYANYFSPDPGLPTTMSNSDNFEFYDAMVNYKQGNYKMAISKWEVLQKTKPNNDTLNYFIGVAYLANKNEKSAISFLETTTKNPSFPLINDAYYYLGLAYLKDGDIENAKTYFKYSNADNSKVLLSKLNE